MKVGDSFMKLGGSKPEGGRRPARVELEQRGDVQADDGTLYEVVWYPHRNAASLLDPDAPGSCALDPHETRGRFTFGSRSMRRSFQG